MSEEIYECPTCGEEHEGIYLRIANDPIAQRNGVTPNDFVLQLCCRCACTAANAFEMRHGSGPLTWDSHAPAVKSRPAIPEELRWDVFRRDSYTCKHCGSGAMLRADHILAWSKGGPTTLENLQTLCHSCNSRKGNR